MDVRSGAFNEAAVRRRRRVWEGVSVVARNVAPSTKPPSEDDGETTHPWARSSLARSLQRSRRPKTTERFRYAYFTSFDAWTFNEAAVRRRRRAAGCCNRIPRARGSFNEAAVRRRRRVGALRMHARVRTHLQRSRRPKTTERYCITHLFLLAGGAFNEAAVRRRRRAGRWGRSADPGRSFNEAAVRRRRRGCRARERHHGRLAPSTKPPSEDDGEQRVVAADSGASTIPSTKPPSEDDGEARPPRHALQQLPPSTKPPSEDDGESRQRVASTLLSVPSTKPPSEDDGEDRSSACREGHAGPSTKPPSEDDGE